MSSLFVKLTSEQMSVFEVCTLASGGCALLLLLARPFSAIRVRPTDTKSKSLTAATTASSNVTALIALRALLGAVTILCYYASVELGDIRDATALFFTSPLFTLVFESLLRRKLPSRHHALSAAFTAAGALMVSHSCVCLLLSSTTLNSSLCPDPTDDSGSNSSMPDWPTPVSLSHSSTATGKTLLQVLLKSPGQGVAARPTTDLVPMALALTAAATNSGAFLSIQVRKGCTWIRIMCGP